ncbi:MAG: hypothetical protein QXX88_00360 [Metallosphaera sp.]
MWKREMEGRGGMVGSLSREQVLESPVDIVHYTDINDYEYPIFITPEKKIVLKKTPEEVLITYYVKDVTETDAEVHHELFEVAVDLVRDVSGKEPYVEKLEVEYEVYVGDRVRMIGKTRGYIIKIVSAETPFSGAKFGRARAWAIGYDWKKRIAAREPRLEKYMYLKGEEWGKGRANVKLYIKLPVVTDEFIKMFNMVMSMAAATQIPHQDLEEQVRKLEELIKQKEQELQALREQLSQLQEKLRLEKMKKAVME